MNKKEILIGFICILLSSTIFLLGYNKKSNPKELFRVYLDGETIGYIENKELLEKYIDDTQQEIKEKYKVDKVYLPNNLDIIKEITYNKSSVTEREMYELIKDKAPFTIDGYIVTIKGTETFDESTGTTTTKDQYIYVLDKELFDKAVKNIVSIFISDSDYNNFINKTQPEIKDVGSLIEDVYIKNIITIKESKISTEEKIFTDEDEINRYMLFGTLDEQKKYVVKDGDIISDIAFNNKLSVKEFLIANPTFTSENNLLYEGQVVNLGLINPAFKLIEEDHVVELQTKTYETKYENDPNVYEGVNKVKQEGKNGVVKVYKKVQKENGEIVSAVITNTEDITPPVNQIIVKGTKKAQQQISITISGSWAWPTVSPYIITSAYGYRWGSYHEGIDISGTGRGSPIFAANNGVVTEAKYTYMNGNYVIIDHQNGIFTIYGHMDSLSVSSGQTVSIGQKIGTMGDTGYAFGVHLHYGVSRGKPFAGGSSFFNPLTLY